MSLTTWSIIVAQVPGKIVAKSPTKPSAKVKVGVKAAVKAQPRTPIDPILLASLLG